MKNWSILLFISMLIVSCGSPNHPEGVLSGRVTLEADSALTSGSVDIRVRAFNAADGFRGEYYLFAVTDSAGAFSSDYRVPLPGLYPVEVSRDGQVIAEIMTVLADQEVIDLSIGFPVSDSTVRIESPENQLYRTLNRLDRNYRRVAAFLQAGVLSEDSTRMEIEKWSTLYWDFYQEHSESVAGQLAASSSVQLLRGLDDSLMIKRIDYSLDRDAAMIPGGILLLTDYYVLNDESSKAVNIIRKTLRKPLHEEHKRTLYQLLTRLEYDRNDMQAGSRLLHQMRRDLPVDPVTMEWTKQWYPEFTRLARGVELPAFQGWADGEMISNESLKGKPFLIEFTRLSNRRYQDQLDRLSVMYQLFQPAGLEIISFAQDLTPLRKDTFMDEWAPGWIVADSVSPGWPELLNIFNLTEAPIRILVDGEGKIFRKYQPGEFDAILPGIQSVLSESVGTEETPSSDESALPSDSGEDASVSETQD